MKKIIKKREKHFTIINESCRMVIDRIFWTYEEAVSYKIQKGMGMDWIIQSN